MLPSYQLLVSRFDAADARLTSLLTLTSTLTIPVPIFAKNVQPDISFASPLFVGGMVVFVLAAIIGVVGRIVGSLVLPDPLTIYDKSLEWSEWEFKKNQLYYAGQNFHKNARAIRTKGNVSIFVTTALLTEVLLLAVWIVRS